MEHPHAKQQQQSQSPEELQEALNLTETQSVQIATAREDMIEELEGVLTTDQIERIMKVAGFI